MNFVGCIPRFLKANAGWVLTALGSLGLVGTSVLVAKEAPKAKQAVYDATVREHKVWIEENIQDIHDGKELRNPGEWPGLTNIDKLKVAAPIYIPAIVTGLMALGCFWGAQIFNVRKQAALISAYGMLAMQFDQYREAIRAEHGEEADKRAYEVSKTEVRKLKNEIVKLKEEHGPFLYEFTTLPGVIFEERPAQLFNALMHYNRNAMLRGANDLHELYQFAGVPESCYDINVAKQYGWQEYENEAGWGMVYIDFEMKPVRNRCGRTVYLIDPVIPPYEIEVDYGFEGRVEDHMYEGYNPVMAKAFAEDSVSGNNVIKVPEDWTCFTMTLF